MSFDVERLYALLPAVHRVRDLEQAKRLGLVLDPGEEADLHDLQALGAGVSAAEAMRRQRLIEKQRRSGGPLKALLAIIAEQAAVLEDDLDRLYDDLFIETCAEWVVPYIGDLVGARRVFVFPGAPFSERAFFANTLAYRRRKGTAATLEQLARDVTGWTPTVVEYFQRLATTQYLNHVRLDNLSVADLRHASALEAIGTPFDRVPRTADVRRIEPRRGRYNIPNVGIFLYRIDSFPVTDAAPFSLDARRYLFDPIGRSIALYSEPETESEITHLAEPINVPRPITRRVLDREKDAYIGAGKSLSIHYDDREAVPSEITVCDLSDHGPGWAHMPATRVAVDPVLGRLAFPSSETPPTGVRVSYHHGFSAEMGSGEYGRTPTFVGTDVPVRVPEHRPTIQQALDLIAATGGVVEISRNDSFAETPAIRAGITRGTTIELRGAEERRPVVLLGGDLSIVGRDESEVTINGLWISGGLLRVPSTDGAGAPNKLRLLRIRHCTLVPGSSLPTSSPPGAPAGPRLVVELPNARIEIEHSIVGAIRAVDDAHVTISNSIVDAGDVTDVAYAGLADTDPGAPLDIRNATVIGQVYTRTMSLASNTIFCSELRPGDGWTTPVRAARLQEGCVRFSYLPPGSRLPRPYRCAPASPAEAERVRPVFTSLRHGQAGYGQLGLLCAAEIRRGADDGAEMGAFHDLYQPQREANLRASLDDYLRFGLEAGIFFAS